MRLLRRFGLYALCLGTLVVVRVLLWLTRYQRIMNWLVKPCQAKANPQRRSAVAATVRALSRSAKLVPGASCLTQTIACQAILSWRSIPSTIEIGVRYNEDGTEQKFNAHAWLMWNGHAVLEAQEGKIDSFSIINSLPTPTRKIVR